MATGIQDRDASGKTPLIHAVWSGDLDAVRRLLRDGADAATPDNGGENALHYAARQEHLDVLRAIIDTGINLDAGASGGYKSAAIHTPAQVGRVPALRLLLERGANPDVPDKFKMTALHWAAQEGQTDSVRALIDFGASVNTKNNKGVTPLMSAVIGGSMECVRLLVDAGAYVNAAAKDGYTALMYAAYYDRAEIAAFLLAHGAEKSATAQKGETAHSIAEKKKHSGVLALMEGKE